GASPIPDPAVKYNFQVWIRTIRVKDGATVSQFAEALHNQARLTFEKLRPVITKEDFWQSDVAKGSVLESYQVIGYDALSAQRCDVVVGFDRKHKRLSYPPPRCLAIGSRMHISTVANSIFDAQVANAT